MEPIEIIIKKKHFTGAAFRDSYHCPLAMATKEHFEHSSMKVGISTIFKDDVPIGEVAPPYRMDEYNNDTHKAGTLQDPEVEIRRVTYTPYTVVINS